MKRILLVFLSLLSVFFVTWGIKTRTPINRPMNIEEEQDVPWYETRYTAPKADEEWYLDPEIPLNYIPVPGEDELYMVVDDSGQIKGYRHRKQAADGSWVWEDVNPDIPEDYEKVDGLDNVYKVTNEDGTVSYYQYVRNEDDTFCFVPVDKKGNPLDDGKPADTIDKNYVHEDGNVYSVYNDNNVKMGYRKRVKKKDGSYVWKVCEAPKVKKGKTGNGTGFVMKGSDDLGQQASLPSGTGNNNDQTQTVVGNSKPKKTTNSDGTYTVTDTTVDTREEDGFTVTYQTTVYSTFDKNGNLLSTKKDGPYEVSRVPVSGTAQADPSKIADTLDGELARVSASVSFDTNMAKEVLAKLNAERKKQGIQPLTMDSNSEAYKLACIRAADMAIYDHASSTSPMYGKLSQMVEMFGCSTGNPSENIWKASNKTASDIHTRFQANAGSRKVRMSNGYTQVGIAIVNKDNQLYIAEIYLN